MKMAEETKICSKCNLPKLLDDFHRGCVCKLCFSEQEVARNDKTRPQAIRLGQHYTCKDDNFIRAHYVVMTDEQMALHLKRTLQGVRAHRQDVLCLIKVSDNRLPGPDDIDHFWFRQRYDIAKVSVECWPNEAGETILAVYSPVDAPEEAIHGALDAAGYSTKVFLAWMVNSVNV